MNAVTPFPNATQPGLTHLRILETTDLHMYLFSYDYYAARPTMALGLSRAAGLIARLRAEAPNALLFDNGDFLQGSPLADYIALVRGLRVGQVHPAIAAMNRMGYDAVTIGNHEFNYGLDFLEMTLAGAEFPVTSANAIRRLGASPDRDETLLPPWLILDRQVVDGSGQTRPLRIGVIGLLPPQTGLWDREALEGRIWFRDILASAAMRVPEMKAAGADLIVALAHTGIGQAVAQEGMENAAVPLAAMPGIDVVLAGHAHLVFPSPGFVGLGGIDPQAGTIHGKPTVMAGRYGSHVGVIDLLLDPQAGWQVVASRSEARPIVERSESGHLRPLAPVASAPLAPAKAAHQATRRYMATHVGQTDLHLNSHFALVADCPALRIVAQAEREHVAQLLRGTEFAGIPVLAAAAPFKAGGRGGPENYTDIRPGALARRHVADLYAFGNDVRAVHLSGAQIVDWLDRSAAIYRTVIPGLHDQPLIDKAFASYNFDNILGVSYAYDPTVPPRYDTTGQLLRGGQSRIRDLRHEGRPVGPDDMFILATNSYRLSAMPASAGSFELVLSRPESWREAVTNWIAACQGPVPVPPCGWSLRLPAETDVLIDTAPTANPAALEPFVAQPMGFTSTGFARFKLRNRTV